MKVAVCDDVCIDRQKLCSLLDGYAKDKNMDLDVCAFSSGEALLEVYKGQFTILFLDIYLQGIDGMQLAKTIRKQDDRCAIIFTTTSREHALQSYEVRATQYLLKPVDSQRLEQALQRCSALFPQRRLCIDVKANRLMRHIYIDEILYIEVYKNTSLIHLRNETIQTYMPLTNLQQQIAQESFLRCHRSYLVNMHAIDEVLEDDFLLCNKEKVPIRRRDRLAIKQAYLDYIWQHTKHSNEPRE